MNAAKNKESNWIYADDRTEEHRMQKYEQEKLKQENKTVSKNQNAICGEPNEIFSNSVKHSGND